MLTKTILTILAFVNVITFLFYGWDKRQAIRSNFRIPEKTLLAFALLGGSLGAIFGAKVFRHKTRKLSYILKFIFILLLQLGIAYLFYYVNNR